MIQESNLQQMKLLGLQVEVGDHLPQLGDDWRCLIVRMKVALELEGEECQYVGLVEVACAIGRAVEVVSHDHRNMIRRIQSEKELDIRKASPVEQR